MQSGSYIEAIPGREGSFQALAALARAAEEAWAWPGAVAATPTHTKAACGDHK